MTRTRSGLPQGRAKLVTVGLAVAALSAALLTPGVANAAVDNPAPEPLVSFTFDDGALSALMQAAPTLQKYELTGTNYVITECVGMSATPNTCRADTDVPYMTWAQIQQLQNTYGWEIGSHTVTHQCLVSVGNDCQATKLTPAQVDAELANSKAALAANGITATAFAPPYGDYDMSAVAQVAKYYSSMRGFADTGNNIWPLGDYLLHNVPVQEVTTPVAALKLKVDEAIAEKKWVVFTFHDIRPNPSQTPDDYQYGTAELEQLAAYVQTKVAAGQIKNVNVSKGLVTGAPNMMPNPTFNNGLGDGWSADPGATITADAGNNGSFPDSTRSVKLVSNNAAPTTASHLYSPKVAVKPATNYLFKAFLNVAAITSGDVSFYVDEYNAAGDWLTGQFKKEENSRWVEAMNFSYTPTSANVASASLQVAVRGTDVTAYVDNVQMLELTAGTTPPPGTQKYPLYKIVYDSTIFEMVPNSGGTEVPTQLTYERWRDVYNFQEPASASTDFVKYPWSPTVYAVTFWPGGESNWMWTPLSNQQWLTAGKPTPRNAGWIKGSYYYQWGTASEIFVEGADGVNHKLTYQEWADSGFRNYVQRSSEGYLKLTWAPEFARMSNLSTGAGRPMGYAEWQAEAFPTPRVVQRIAGDQFYKTCSSSTIWYAGPGMNRPVNLQEWQRAGSPSPTVSGTCS
jgi:peptidoglycan/xylan/chitin deacetylase (PgdA/CDA1 family)